MDQAINYYNSLITDVNSHIQSKLQGKLGGVPENRVPELIKTTPDDFTNYIYSNENFKSYAKYSFLVKYFQKKISTILMIILILSILVGVGVFLFTRNIIITIIVAIVLVLLNIFISKKIDPYESYSEFYKRTMYNLIFNILDGVSVKYSTVNSINKQEVSPFVKEYFTEIDVDNYKTFSGELFNGKMFNLSLKKEIKQTRNDGSKSTTKEEVYDGFMLDINYENSFKNLDLASIRITADETLLSSLAEDTINSIYQSDRDFMFNSEELNKSLDCRICGINTQGDIDALMMKIQQIITPTFENHLLFLKERYNAFNLTISDRKINFNVDMKQSMFQKMKAGEMFKFNKTYKDFTKKVILPDPELSGCEDFMFYNIFPAIEQLFLIKYFDVLIKNSLNKEMYISENASTILSFEEYAKNLASTEMEEVKNIHKELIEGIYESSKILKEEV